MKNLKKLTAVSLTVAMLAAFSGCGDQSWSYKTDDVSLSAGTYIYNLLNGYYEAYDKVDTPDEAEDILKEEVTDSDDDTTKTVEQFALDTADEETTKMIAVEELFKKYNLELDEGDYETYKGYTSQVWSSMKQTLEDYGISEKSFEYCYAEYSVKSNQVFEYLYGKDGEKYVTDDELIKYYKDKYTGYAYFSLSMTDYDDEGNAVPKSDDEIKKAGEAFTAYADLINKDKKDYKDVVHLLTTRHIPAPTIRKRATLPKTWLLLSISLKRVRLNLCSRARAKTLYIIWFTSPLRTVSLTSSIQTKTPTKTRQS